MAEEPKSADEQRRDAEKERDRLAREREDTREQREREEREAAEVYDSPAYAKGPQVIPPAGQDPDTLQRQEKYNAAVRIPDDRDHDESRGRQGQPTGDQKSEDDSQTPEQRKAAEDEAARQRAAAARAAGTQSADSSPQGRRAGGKQTG